MNIAIIPARGGSKRIPRKNIKQFCGLPMIAYAILAAKECELFDHIVVSTDDEEIASVARSLGAEVPFYRPLELSDDYASTSPVVNHAIRECLNLGWNFKFTCCIYPGVPFLKAEDLQGAFDCIKDGRLNYCFPVAKYPSPIQRALKMLSDYSIQPFSSDFELKRTQDLEFAYYDAGQFYWAANEVWFRKPKIHSDGLGYQIPNWRAIDIDTPEDWRRAELVYQAITSSHFGD